MPIRICTRSYSLMFKSSITKLRSFSYSPKTAFIFAVGMLMVLAFYIGSDAYHKRNAVYNHIQTFYFPVSSRSKSFLVSTPGCQIPKLNPFDRTVRQFLVKTPYNFNCGSPKPILRAIKGGLVDVDEVELWKQHRVRRNQLDCSFFPILRNVNVRKPDDAFFLGKKHDFVFDLPIDEDFVLMECRKKNVSLVRDLLALTPLKPEVEKRCERAQAMFGLPRENLNIIMVGIDSISKLNFIRYFDKSLSYLRNNLSAVELHGYTKVADNTYPNMIPLLTGHHSSYYNYKEKHRKFYDDAELIWKAYSSVGYRTLFSEDAPKIATFDLNRRGFRFPPADYYSRPFAQAMENSRFMLKKYCIGSKLEMEVYFDYLRNLISTMKDRPFFAFSFMARLTHDLLKMAGYADKPSFELLKYLDQSGVLNTSILIFFSDHGIRFGDIRQTYVGKIEERMPFIFIVLPDWFPKRYPYFTASLKINERRLATPYDVHATLSHILDLKQEQFFTAHGQSLFNEISPMRTCEEARIIPHWCVCQIHHPVPVTDSRVTKAVASVLLKVNEHLRPFIQVCVKLELDVILDARVGHPHPGMLTVKADSKKSLPLNFFDFLLTMSVKPSRAVFEATVRMRNGRYQVIDDISRINMYGNQSHCIDNPVAKKYCLCKDMIRDS